MADPGHARPALVDDLHLDKPVPGQDGDRDRTARSTRAAIPHAVPEQLAGQQDRHGLARVPRKHCPHKDPDNPRPLRQARKRHALPRRCPSHQPHQPSPPDRPRENHRGCEPDAGKCTLDSATYVKPEHDASDPSAPLLATALRGTSGFGYDPIFIPDTDSGHSSYAQMTSTEMTKILHRSRTVGAMHEGLGLECPPGRTERLVIRIRGIAIVSRQAQVFR